MSREQGVLARIESPFICVTDSYGIIRPINRTKFDENLQRQRSYAHDVHDDGHANAHSREADFPLRCNFSDTHTQELLSAALF